MNYERLAREFHDIYERLAPKFGYMTREDTRNFDPNSPNGKLMIATFKEFHESIEEKEETIETILQAEEEERKQHNYY